VLLIVAPLAAFLVLWRALKSMDHAFMSAYALAILMAFAFLIDLINKKHYLEVAQAFSVVFVYYQGTIVLCFIAGFFEADYREMVAERLISINAFFGFTGTMFFAVWSVPVIQTPGCDSSCTDLDYSFILQLMAVVLLPIQMVCFAPCNSCECVRECATDDTDIEEIHHDAPVEGDETEAPAAEEMA